MYCILSVLLHIIYQFIRGLSINKNFKWVSVELCCKIFLALMICFYNLFFSCTFQIDFLTLIQLLLLGISPFWPWCMFLLIDFWNPLLISYLKFCIYVQGLYWFTIFLYYTAFMLLFWYKLTKFPGHIPF